MNTPIMLPTAPILPMLPAAKTHTTNVWFTARLTDPADPGRKCTLSVTIPAGQASHKAARAALSPHRPGYYLADPAPIQHVKHADGRMFDRTQIAARFKFPKDAIRIDFKKMDPADLGAAEWLIGSYCTRSATRKAYNTAKSIPTENILWELRLDATRSMPIDPDTQDVLMDTLIAVHEAIKGGADPDAVYKAGYRAASKSINNNKKYDSTSMFYPTIDAAGNEIAESVNKSLDAIAYHRNWYHPTAPEADPDARQKAKYIAKVFASLSAPQKQVVMLFARMPGLSNPQAALILHKDPHSIGEIRARICAKACKLHGVPRGKRTRIDLDKIKHEIIALRTSDRLKIARRQSPAGKADAAKIAREIDMDKEFLDYTGEAARQAAILERIRPHSSFEGEILGPVPAPDYTRPGTPDRKLPRIDMAAIRKYVADHRAADPAPAPAIATYGQRRKDMIAEGWITTQARPDMAEVIPARKGDPKVAVKVPSVMHVEYIPLSSLDHPGKVYLSTGYPEGIWVDPDDPRLA